MTKIQYNPRNTELSVFYITMHVELHVDFLLNSDLKIYPEYSAAKI